jgi:hypothetical protein
MFDITALKQYKEENRELNAQLKKLITSMKNQKNKARQAALYDEIQATLDGMSVMSRKISEELAKVFK